MAVGLLRGPDLALLLLTADARTGLLDDIDEDAGVGTASSEESRDDVSGKDAIEPSRNFDGILD